MNNDVISFTLTHSGTGESRTVTLTRAEIQECMAEEILDKLGAEFCQCEPIGETNVVGCSCPDYLDDFEFSNDHAIAMPKGVSI